MISSLPQDASKSYIIKGHVKEAMAELLYTNGFPNIWIQQELDVFLNSHIKLRCAMSFMLCET